MLAAGRFEVLEDSGLRLCIAEAPKRAALGALRSCSVLADGALFGDEHGALWFCPTGAWGGERASLHDLAAGGELVRLETTVALRAGAAARPYPEHRWDSARLVPEGPYAVLVAGHSRDLYVFDLDALLSGNVDAAEVRVVSRHGAALTAVSDATAAAVAAGDERGALRVYMLQNESSRDGAVVVWMREDAHARGAVTAVVLVSEASPLVISGGRDGCVVVWSFGDARETGDLLCVREINVGLCTPTALLAVSRRGAAEGNAPLLVVAAAEGTVSVWSASGELELRCVADDTTAAVTCVHWRGASSTLVAADAGGAMRAYSYASTAGCADTMTLVAECDLGSSVLSLAIDADDALLAVTGGGDAWTWTKKPGDGDDEDDADAGEPAEDHAHARRAPSPEPRRDASPSRPPPPLSREEEEDSDDTRHTVHHPVRSADERTLDEPRARVPVRPARAPSRDVATAAKHALLARDYESLQHVPFETTSPASWSPRTFSAADAALNAPLAQPHVARPCTPHGPRPPRASPRRTASAQALHAAPPQQTRAPSPRPMRRPQAPPA